jgi:hypothetical protein
MNVEQVASASFVLLQADWSVDKARRVLDELLTATHVIVHRRDGLDEYHLLTLDEALHRMNWVVPDTPLRQALDLRAQDAVPLVDLHADAEVLPERCLVHDQGRVVGFFDAILPPPVRGFPTRGPAEESSPDEPTNRSLVTEFPGRVAKGDVAWLLVNISTTLETGTGIPVTVPPTGTQVDILVQPRRGFVVQGNERLTLTVSDEEETLPVQFKLLAVDLGPGRVNVLAFHDGQPLGRITLTPVVQDEVTPTSGGSGSGARRQNQPLADVTVRVPDLMMLIDEHRVGQGIEYVVRLTAPAHGLNLKAFGPIRLRTDPMAFFADFFEEIEALPLGTSQEKAVAARKLAARGANLFRKVFPEKLQETLWSLRHSINSIIVQSEEPWIPWELCKLYGEEDGRVTEGPFLCEAYSMTRWVPGLDFKQPLSLNNLALVVPDDSNLPFAPSERDYVLSLAGDGREVSRIPATYVDVQSALASGRYDGWHFTGHGAARNENPDRAAMFLENDEPFTPEDVSGVVTNLRTGRPVVFLNACQIGRGGMSLTDVGGWATRFVDAGAGVFIGTYWNVYDEAAFEFAQAVYGRLLGGIPIGRAVKEARMAIRPLGDPTWLAYTVFADPLARVHL